MTAEGLVEVNGQIEGNLHCTSLIVSPKAQIVGSIAAERVVVDGSVEGPIQGGDVVLKSRAHVVGDIRHQSLAIEKGAYLMAAPHKPRALMGHGKYRVRRILQPSDSRRGAPAEASVGWRAVATLADIGRASLVGRIPKGSIRTLPVRRQQDRVLINHG